MIWVSSAVVALVAVFASPASAHGGAVDVVVSEDAGLVRAAMVWKKDQEPVTDYLRVSFTAVDVDGRTFGPYPLYVDRAKRGQYVSQRQLPAGIWQVTVTGAGRFQVWGAATLGAGRPDSARPDAIASSSESRDGGLPGRPILVAAAMVAGALALLHIGRARRDPQVAALAAEGNASPALGSGGPRTGGGT